MEFIEYRYLNPLSYSNDTPALNINSYELMPPLLSGLLNMYSNMGLKLQDFHIKNYPHDYLGQTSQINIQSATINGESGILDFISLSEKGELKYATPSMLPPHKSTQRELIGRIEAHGQINPYSEKLRFEDYRANHDFIRALDIDSEFNSHLSLVLMSFCAPCMRNSRINATRISKLSEPHPQFKIEAYDENFGKQQGLIVPFRM